MRYFARKDELLRVSYGFDSRREYQNDCEDSRFLLPTENRTAVNTARFPTRLRHKVLTRSRALSLPENTASDSRATKSSIFSMNFGKNERSCTLPYYKRDFAKRHGNCGDLARFVLLLPGMDDKNVEYLKNLFAPDEKKKVKKFLEYAGQSRDVADPYYTGNFDDTYDDLKIGIEFLINNIENRK